MLTRQVSNWNNSKISIFYLKYSKLGKRVTSKAINDSIKINTILYSDLL